MWEEKSDTGSLVFKKPSGGVMDAGGGGGGDEGGIIMNETERQISL